MGMDMMDLPAHLAGFPKQIDELRRLAQLCWQRGWSPAGSGSFSLVIDRQPFRMLTTIGHTCRGHLQPADFAIVDDHANPIYTTTHKQFKETLLHVWLARQQQAQVIVQTHSVWSVLLADRFGPLDGVLLEGFQLLQRLPDAESESHVEWLPIVMSYDQAPLIQAVERAFNDTPAEMTRPPRACLIQQYGMLTWADDSDKVQNQAELFEYFAEYLVRRASLN
jgi:methylthioribulose-1-phosphate dehydratase